MMVQWFAELALNREVLGSIPATSQKFKVKRIEDKMPLAALMLL